MISLVALTLLVGFRPPKYAMGSLPYQAHWGEYTVRVTGKIDAEDVNTFANLTFKITDRRGRLVKALGGRIEEVEFVKMGTHLPTAIHVLWQEEGAGHYGYTDYIFTRQDGVRCALMFEGDDFGIESFRDLNGDGQKEILAASAVLAYDGYSFASSPAVFMIFGWNGKEYVNQTPRFAWRVRLKGANYQNMVKKALRKIRYQTLHQKRDYGEWDDDELHGAIAGYFGNLYEIRRKAETRLWLKKRLPKNQWVWFQQHQSSWRQGIESLEKDHPAHHPAQSRNRG